MTTIMDMVRLVISAFVFTADITNSFTFENLKVCNVFCFFFLLYEHCNSFDCANAFDEFFYSSSNVLKS